MSWSRPDAVVMITGASRGIGAATAIEFAKGGAQLILAARDGTRLDRVAEDVRRAGGTALVVPTDVTNPDAVEALITQATAEVGPLDVLVNNVGGNPYYKPTLDWTLEEWDQVIDLNLRSAFHVAAAAGRAMVTDGQRGVIIAVSSVGGDVPVPNTIPYCVAKAGLSQLMRGLALELAQYGIRVSSVAPGFVATDLTESLRDHPHMLAGLESAIPLGRLGDVSEVAQAVCLLAEAEYVTGATLTLDGGYSLSRAWPSPRPARSVSD